jgi:NACalpha-BTF3-like transcription factor
MFLASLMVASKYLQDKNYRNKAWAKISGLDIKEINGAETAFLKIIDYQLFISKPTFDRWFNLLNLHVDQMQQQQQQQQQQTAEETKPTRMYPTPTSSPVRHAPYRKPVQQHYPSPPNSIHEYENAGVSPAAASQLMFTLPVSRYLNSSLDPCFFVFTLLSNIRIRFSTAHQTKRKLSLWLSNRELMK